MTTAPHATRWLAIGEFAAATQLSLKALRLYAEQRLLVPARVDGASGYRYYRGEQVAQGRLIRTLREMGLSLADLGAIVAVDAAAARRLLNAFAKEQDQRYAREKRAYRAALVQLQPVTAVDVPAVLERRRAAMTVACREFTADRQTFFERYRAERQALQTSLAAARLAATGAIACRLVDPLSEEEGRAEVIIPVTPGVPLAADLTFRQLADAHCAVIVLAAGFTHASQFAGALDTLFDWFDRRGHAASDCPCVSIEDDPEAFRVEIAWPFAMTATS